MSTLHLHTLSLYRGAGAAERDRPTIVMLHGWQSDLRSMELLGDLLSAHYPVRLLDLPGFGGSEMHDGSWGTPEYAARVLTYCEEQGLSQVILVGHSFGGRVSLRLAHSRPDLVAGLVLIGAAGLQPVGWRRFKRDVKRFLNRFLKRKFASRDYLNAGALRATLVRAVTEDLSPLAAEIAAPALLIYGAADDETPPSLGQRYQQLLRNSQLIVLADKGHFPFAGTGASLCARHILDFLAEGNQLPRPKRGTAC